MAKLPDFNKGSFKGNKNYKYFGLYLLVLIIGISIISSFFDPITTDQQELTYSQFLKEVEANNVLSVTIVENSISGTLSGGTEFTTYSPDDPEMINILRNKNIIIDAKPPAQP